jgi:hypothetical protein
MIKVKSLRSYLLLVILLLIVIISLTGCVFYGTPDSPLVNVVGRDIKNFNDMTRTQDKVLELNDDYLVLYKQKIPNARTRFALLDTSTGFDETILIDSQEIKINCGFILPNKNLIAFIVTSDGIYYLILYDYKSRINLDEIIIIKKHKGHYNDEGNAIHTNTGKTVILNPNPGFIIETYFTIDNVEFSTDKKYIFIKLAETPWSFKNEKPTNYAMKSFKIQNNKFIDVSNMNNKKFEMAKDVQTGYKLKTSDGNTKSLFIIEPDSDYLPANYKPKYKGLNIRDEHSNQTYLISKNYNYSSHINESVPVWIDDGKMVAYDSNILDCTGKFKEKKLVDGTIVHMIKKSSIK